jgi:hypothetical protein
MPSDTAFLWDVWDMPAGGSLATAYDDLGGTLDAYPRKAHDLSMTGTRFSPREFSSVIENLRALGLDIDENNKMLRGLRLAILTNYSLYSIYAAYRAIVKAREATELGLAVGETIAMAVAQQWHRIAQAATAAVITYAAFNIGERFGSGDWNLPSVNTHNPADRRVAARQVSQLGY